MDDEAKRAAGRQHPHRLGQRAGEVRIFDPVLADHRAEAFLGEGEGLDVGARVEADRREIVGVAADEGGRVDVGLVDRDDLEALVQRAPRLGGDDRGGAVAGAQVDDPGGPGELREEGAPPRRDALVIIGRARAVEA